jgi:hypothetical protein
MTEFLEKAMLQGFEESVDLENKSRDTTFPRSSNFATLFAQK